MTVWPTDLRYACQIDQAEANFLTGLWKNWSLASRAGRWMYTDEETGGQLDYPMETIMWCEVKALSSALFLSNRFGPKLRFSVGRVPWFATRNVCRIVWNILTAWGKNYAGVFIRLPVAKPNKVLRSVYIEKRQNCGRIGKREFPVASLLKWDDYLTFGEREIVISGKYKKAWNYWNYSIGLCIVQRAG